MKKYLALIILFCNSYAATYAQDCKNFIYMTSGKVLKYSASNPKGKVTSTMQYSVKSITGNKAIINSQVFDEKGKELNETSFEIICEGNSMKIDMRNFMPSTSSSQFKGMTVKADATYLNYPAKIQVGQDLPDGNFTMQMFNDTQKMADMALNIVNRKVENMESVTTSAGTFDCYKISYNSQIKTTTFGISIPINMKITEWYSTKLGLNIKSEASNKKGKLISTTTLVSLN